jgi:signal transduction histidine kinase/class 3 adenylate cyclase/ligand-binding sensor domain-containing protein/ActR/RegA family two-component response regulator
MRKYIKSGILICCLLHANLLYAQPERILFQHLDENAGLSSNIINNISQDSQGFMWFGTENGLNRFDGYKMKIYKSNPDDLASITHVQIHALMNDRFGNLWIGFQTPGIFNRYDAELDRFVKYPMASAKAFTEDLNGNLWISSPENDVGCIVLNVRDSIVTHYNHNPEDPRGLSGNAVSSLYTDVSGIVWLGAGGGLNRFNPEDSTFTVFHKGKLGWITSITDDHIGNLWLIEGTNIFIFNKSDGSLRTFEEFTGLEWKAYPNCLFTDSRQNIWIGTGMDGLLLYKPDEKTLHQYKHDPADPFSISTDGITSIFEDDARNLWIGTWGGGICVIRGFSYAFEHFLHDPENQSGLSSPIVNDLAEDKAGNLWITTEGGGMNLFNRKNLTYKHYRNDPFGPNFIGSDILHRVLIDSEGNVWCNGWGLHRMDPERENSFERYRLPGLNWGIYEDRDGTVWSATSEGLFKYDRGSNSFQAYQEINYADSGVASEKLVSVFGMWEDRNGKFWISTMTGLYTFNRKEETFTKILDQGFYHVEEFSREGLLLAGNFGLYMYYPEKDSLSMYIKSGDLDLVGLVEDNTGIYWFPTNKGIVKFDPDTRKQRRFGKKDGLILEEFIMNSFGKTRDGYALLGAKGGFVMFHPDSLQNNPVIPEVHLTDFKLYNQSLPISKSYYDTLNSPLTKSISSLDHIELSYLHNIFSIEFAALNYLNPERNQYKYKLEGFNDEWTYTSADNRVATYTNLNSGNYRFVVEGSNDDGIWNPEPAILNITVLPPWWLTWWAKAIYILLFIGSVWGFIYFRTQQQKRKLKEAQELNKKLEQVDKLKDQFLANTSHELRTPLQGIIGLSESLNDGVAGEMTGEAKDLLQMITTSGKRLSYLVNDILDFSKLKNNELALQLRPLDIHAAANVVLTLVRPLLKNKDLKLKNNVPRKLSLAMADENRVQQIFQNLVGNAIKFTEKGTISISAEEEDSLLRITVSDTGIGIAGDKLESIFIAFEQADGSVARDYGGTGLGLSVTKQLVELHGGTITVNSELKKGTDFTFTLPASDADRKDLPELEFAKGLEDTVHSVELLNQEAKSSQVEKIPEPLVRVDETKGRILVVDDEPVNLQVVQNYLSMAGYEVVLANSGKEAIKIIKKEEKFDLIILDVMMPQLSGYEVCTKLREMFLPSELPVVLLTAKNRVTDLGDGFSAGANDYLTKPFSKDELLSRIKTHLHLQKIHQATGKFVPFEFLHFIGRESIVDVHLGDQTHQEVTVLFCDIRDYTTIAEDMSPEDNFKMINSFVGKMGPIIKQNRGFVNQFIGDAIMAIFPKNGKYALQAAIEMQIKLSEYNQARIEKGRIPIQVGVGLHTGPLIMDMIGDANRTDTTTIAETLNIASRMEGLTKYYGVQILISQDSYRCLSNHEDFHFRVLGEVLVKGKNRPVKIYECYDGEEPEMFNKKKEMNSAFNEGLSHYYNKDFPEASVYFNNIVKKNPKDKTAQYYYKLAIKYAMDGVPYNWSGIEKLLEK